MCEKKINQLNSSDSENELTSGGEEATYKPSETGSLCFFDKKFRYSPTVSLSTFLSYLSGIVFFFSQFGTKTLHPMVCF